jgi:hypothetical protein
MKTLLNSLRTLFTKNKPVYRLVTETIHDAVTLDIYTFYYIEEKKNLNWYQIGYKFEDYDKCLKYFAKWKENIQKNTLNYEYINKTNITYGN